VSTNQGGARHRAAGEGDGGSESALRIVWLYPDLLSTYGDRGNMLILARRAFVRGIPVETVEVRSDEKVPEHGDIYLLGGGEDGPQALAAQRLNADRGLHRAVHRPGDLRRLSVGRHVLLRQG
jgi:CobQ-like glutamine amidotransferase family enzyme